MTRAAYIHIDIFIIKCLIVTAVAVILDRISQTQIQTQTPVLHQNDVIPEGDSEFLSQQ